MVSLQDITVAAGDSFGSWADSVTNAPVMVLTITGVPFVLSAAALAFRSYSLDSLEGGRAVTLYQAGAGVGGFLTFALAGAMLDNLGRPVHIAELLPGILAVGLSGVVAAYVLTPPNLPRAYSSALSKAGLRGGA